MNSALSSSLQQCDWPHWRKWDSIVGRRKTLGINSWSFIAQKLCGWLLHCRSGKCFGHCLSVGAASFTPVYQHKVDAWRIAKHNPLGFWVLALMVGNRGWGGGESPRGRQRWSRSGRGSEGRGGTRQQGEGEVAAVRLFSPFPSLLKESYTWFIQWTRYHIYRSVTAAKRGGVVMDE